MTKPKELDIPVEQQVIIGQIMHEHGYESLKKTQEFAFNNGILDDGNDLLIAETGNGKTLTAEAVTLQELEAGNRVAYLVPSRQLVWAKRNSIRDWATPEYDVLTGGNKYDNADVVVATFESFYQAILRKSEGALNLDAIILDDFHEIYSGFRGYEIEIAISAALKRDMDIFGISATIGNPKTIADWMDGNVLISPEDRQTPIKEFSVDSNSKSTKQTVVDTITDNRDQGPFLVFCFAKSWTESRAGAIADADVFDGPSKDINLRNELSNRVDGVLTDTHKELLSMMRSGVAYVHADLPGTIKQYVLDLYEEGELQAITTTTSLAYGFDSPVQSVIIADIKRRGNYVGVYEYVQWAGRAARPRFSHPCGYCYTLTDEPEETEQKFFEPHRELEDVETHIDSDNQFRWLILELIKNERSTRAEIEEFVKETLYWEQMSPEEGWGTRDPRSKNEILEDRLAETTDWLEDNGFINQSKTVSAFEPTRLGKGAVNFHYNSWIDVDLLSIKSFYNWINDTDPDEMTQLDYIYRTITNFSLEMNENDADGKLEPILQEQGYNVTKASTTAGLMRWYWMRNYSNNRIEQETGIDPTYIPSAANTLSDTVDATKHIVKAAPSGSVKDWHDSLVNRINKGVRPDAETLVSEVSSLGRTRARFLRQYLNQMARQTLDVEPDEHICKILKELHAHTERDDQFKEILSDNVDMVGDVTAENLTEFVNSQELKQLRMIHTEEEYALSNQNEKTTVTEDDLTFENKNNNNNPTSLKDF